MNHKNMNLAIASIVAIVALTVVASLSHNKL